MNKIINHTKKKPRDYVQPEIFKINIDNEISLALESEPPTMDNENVIGFYQNKNINAEFLLNG